MLTFFATFALLTACDADVTPIPNDAPSPDPATTVVGRTALDLGAPVGISVAPGTGERYLIDAWDGLYAFGADGTTLVAGPDVIIDPAFGDERPYTDVAAMGGAKLAVAVQSDGLLVDLDAASAARHFCYEPGYYGYNYDVTVQITDSLAYHAASDVLVANPQTITNDVAERSDLAQFQGATGVPLAWTALGDPAWRAGALAVTADGTWLLGREALVFRATADTVVPEPLFDLHAFGIGTIAGLAVDENGDLLVLDGDDAEVVTIANWDLL